MSLPAAGMAANLEGKRALIEVRESRRWHSLVIAELKAEDDGLYAIFPRPFAKRNPGMRKIRVPQAQASHFEASLRRDYDLKLGSVLYLVDHQSDDTCAWVRPPIIVTQADIDAEKNGPTSAESGRRVFE